MSEQQLLLRLSFREGGQVLGDGFGPALVRRAMGLSTLSVLRMLAGTKHHG